MEYFEDSYKYRVDTRELIKYTKEESLETQSVVVIVEYREYRYFRGSHRDKISRYTIYEKVNGKLGDMMAEFSVLDSHIITSRSRFLSGDFICNELGISSGVVLYSPTKTPFYYNPKFERLELMGDNLNSFINSIISEIYYLRNKCKGSKFWCLYTDGVLLPIDSVYMKEYLKTNNTVVDGLYFLLFDKDGQGNPHNYIRYGGFGVMNNELVPISHGGHLNFKLEPYVSIEYPERDYLCERVVDLKYKDNLTQDKINELMQVVEKGLIEYLNSRHKEG